MAHGLTPSDVGIDVGQVLEGKYRVDAILGRGGMGVVLECTHLGLNERVALKVLRADVLNDHDAVQRFVREARAAVKLKSEYVAHVSDVGTFENGTPFMVMEFLEGQDIGQLLEERGTVAVPWATELILQTAEALCEAHSLGIVHRDVKPSNLFVTWRPDGSALVKVLDFGISKSVTGTDINLTQTQSVLGTPAYMSPEQMRSARMVDSRSDIWSLGTVLYEMLEGHRPFEADNFSEMVVKVAMDEPLPMQKTPPALQKIILRCLTKQPEQRYATMAELGRELVPFAQSLQQAQHLVERMTRMLRRSHLGWDGDPSISGPIAAADSAPLATSTVMTVPEPRRTWPWVAAMFVLAVGGIGIALGISRGDAATAPLPASFLSQRVSPPVPVIRPTPPPPMPPPVVPDPTKAIEVVKAPAKVVHPKTKPVVEALPPPVIDTSIKTDPGSAACDPWRAQHGQCPK